jgi:hypothetical protein
MEPIAYSIHEACVVARKHKGCNRSDAMATHRGLAQPAEARPNRRV